MLKLDKIDSIRLALINNLAKEPDESVIKSEYVRCVSELLTKAVYVFNSEEAACIWLHEPNHSMEEFKPLKVPETEGGVERVSDILDRIEHGFYS